MRYSKAMICILGVTVFTQLCGCKSRYESASSVYCSVYTITSEPSNASVTVGYYYKQTPVKEVQVVNPDRGTVSCTIRKEGWEEQQKELPVEGGVFHFVLKELPTLLRPLSQVVTRPTYEVEYKSQIDKEVGAELKCSIGDVLFHIERYTLGHEKPAVIPPRELNGFPNSHKWVGTHTYNAEDGIDHLVYTNKDYMEGDIGVMLDSDEIMATSSPYIQVGGSKHAPIRWGKHQPIAFFVRERETVEVWGLRYGGKRDGNYQFEVIDQVNPKEIEIVQEVMISQEEFARGFIVKGVLVTGVSESDLGLLTYTVKDVLVKN